MKLLNILNRFKKDESGAVTVDWVVLTGAVVGLGIIIAQTMGTSITTAAGGVSGNKTMKMLKLFKSFKNDESGAVTVDWVVLTGAVVGLGII
eukprot:gene60529-biopygen50371